MPVQNSIPVFSQQEKQLVEINGNLCNLSQLDKFVIEPMVNKYNPVKVSQIETVSSEETRAHTHRSLQSRYTNGLVGEVLSQPASLQLQKHCSEEVQSSAPLCAKTKPDAFKLMVSSQNSELVLQRTNTFQTARHQLLHSQLRQTNQVTPSKFVQDLSFSPVRRQVKLDLNSGNDQNIFDTPQGQRLRRSSQENRSTTEESAFKLESVICEAQLSHSFRRSQSINQNLFPATRDSSPALSIPKIVRAEHSLKPPSHHLIELVKPQMQRRRARRHKRRSLEPALAILKENAEAADGKVAASEKGKKVVCIKSPREGPRKPKKKVLAIAASLINRVPEIGSHPSVSVTLVKIR